MLRPSMQVSCTQCGKAYVLPAGSAAVPGIKLRVKCKSCQKVFEVTEEMMAAAAKKGEESLSALPDAKPSDPNAIGEVTRHFIEKSGANKRNPPWKIALFVLGGIGLPLGVLFLLSSFKIATVKVVNENGEEVEQGWFTGEGISAIGDKLSGKDAEKRAAAKARAEARRKASPTDGAKSGDNPFELGGRRGGNSGTAATMDGKVTGSLGAFYGDNEKKDRGPRVRKDDAESGAAQAHAGGLDETQAAKVVAHSQIAFQDCIESALRRNPHLKVGKVSMAVSVAPSGTVKGASISPKIHQNSDWGQCLTQRARRMVFPPFDGDDEAEVEVPLVVGVSL
jgi:hypothetical protein